MATDHFLGEIRLFPFYFVPSGWAFCDGQLLPISQNTALFSLLGTNYGGDGKSTFALPDLQGRVAIHAGQGPGLSHYPLGQEGGEASVSLMPLEIPVHSHTLQYGTSGGAQESPAGRIWRDTASRRGGLAYASPANPVVMGPQALVPAGGSQPHNNMQPYLTLHFCIALEGIFPPRQ